MMKSRHISLNEYSDFCVDKDISPTYSPALADYYFTQLGRKPQILGRFDSAGRLIAAYPTLFGQVFPNALHKRLLGEDVRKLGDFGQPEALIPVAAAAGRIALNRLSPITSPLLKGALRSLGQYSVRSVAIARAKTKSSMPQMVRAFFRGGGKAYFTQELDKEDFAEVRVRLYSRRWNRDPHDLRYVVDQIRALYEHVFGCVVEHEGEPAAVMMTFMASGRSICYFDAVLTATKPADNKRTSYGSVLYFTTANKAKEISQAAGKALRYSYGYMYGPRDYKHLWATPEPTFIAY
jgi:hypothetical protein